MDAEVEQTLGDVEGTYTVCSLLAPRGEHELVHTRAVVGQVEDLLEEHAQVVGIQHGGLAQRPKALRAVHAQVGVAASENAEVTLKPLESADAPGPVEVESVASVGLLHHQRRWQERLEQLVDDDWARARTTRAVWRGEG